MIIVQLSGGFGNQLFQYAAGLSLATYHHVEIKVDVSLLEQKDPITGTLRTMDIFKLNNPPLKASEIEINTFLNLAPIASYFDKTKPFYKRKVYKEKSNLFDQNFFKAGDDLLLKGNRQSEKYFKHIEQKISSDFSLSDKVIANIQSFGNSLSIQNSVAIHIRRGDYLTPVAQEWLGLLPMAYYNKAIEIMAEKFGACKFYIFSDDITWTKQNLNLKFEHEFVSGMIAKNALEDFYLMSKCKHNIIANSTFSWWSAWLNQHPHKMIIAPQKWFNKPGLSSSDLVPENWIRL